MTRDEAKTFLDRRVRIIRARATPIIGTVVDVESVADCYPDPVGINRIKDNGIFTWCDLAEIREIEIAEQSKE